MNKNKPSRWYYVLASLIPIFACVVTGLIMYGKIPNIPGALEALGIENLTQVVVPGSAEIHFSEPGAYAVYYEYRSVVDGVNYYWGEFLPSLQCQLRSKKSGESVRLDYSTVEGDVYTYPERAGVLYKLVSIDQPGVYNFSCQYPDGRSSPEIVMAVGPNLIWEFFNVALKPISALFCAGFAFVFASGISILIIGIVAYQRHRSKDPLRSN